ncbi:glutamate 5-kinase [Marinisporobacter balticus]|uniref:Glutamate 5-kinase n=1 Tax=Marinisporobacter balticus TaxID=2018667 RepID=A0A4R2L798_9FIRM|nr:glutamate 5-kinase [Marinisporobacter balticus]TCO79876.1 glutamate 5-kinase [Marinisporobacter balticus]
MLTTIMKTSRKIVVKIGSNTLANEDGTINKEFLQKLSEQVNYLKEQGKQIVIVSSGARIAGVATISKWMRKGDIHYKQALCAIGQVELMDSYRKAFSKYGMHIGQMLLTREDLFDANRTLNIRNTLFTLIDEGVIPIINENDTVCVEEIKIGDNDTLAALTANLWDADLLVMCSDIDGVFSKNPKEHKDARLLEEVDDIDALLKNIEIGAGNDFGTGGIETKIEAARRVNNYGIPMILVNGKKENMLLALLEGTQKATLFIPK